MSDFAISLTPAIRLPTPIHTSSTGHLNVSGRTLTVRELASASDSYCGAWCEWFTSIPIKIKDFFAHCYADVRMFYRAFVSMGNGTTRLDINNRTDALRLFKRDLEIALNHEHPAGVLEAFDCLNANVQGLLFYADRSYIQSLAATSRGARLGIREEILREVEQAIYYQGLLRSVNDYYHTFGGKSNPQSSTTQQPSGNNTTQTTTQPSPTPVTAEPAYAYDSNVGRRTLPDPNGGVPSLRSPTANMNVPNTVRYNPYAIPRDVVEKANEIIWRAARFPASGDVDADFNTWFTARLPAGTPATNEDISCPIAQTVMAIPVFCAEDGSGAVRHRFDADSLNQALVAYTGHSDQCAVCRHQLELDRFQFAGRNVRIPVNGLIDKKRQDDILAFLRDKVREPWPGVPTTSV